MTDNQISLSYKDAGVDIDAGDELVHRIKDVAKRTSRPGVLGGLGGFGALFELPEGYKQPVLVSGTDGGYQAEVGDGSEQTRQDRN